MNTIKISNLKENYSYFICGAGALQQLVSIGLVYSAFGAYLPYIASAFDFTNTQMSLIIAIRSVSILISLAVIDKYISILGARFGLLVSDILAALGFIIFSQATKITDFYLGAVLIGACNGLGGLATVSVLINKWFVTDRSTALGISSAGSSIAIITMPTLTVLLVENLGLEVTFLLEGIFIAVRSMVVFIFVRNTPEEISSEAHGQCAAIVGKDAKHTAPKSRETAISRAAFLLTMVSVGLLGASGNVISFLTMLYTGNGYSAIVTSYILSIVGIVLIPGKVFFGRMTDKIGAYRSSLIVSILMIIGTVMSALSFCHSTVLVVVAILCNGLGWSITSLGMNVFSEMFASQEQYDHFTERFSFAYTLGCLIFSYAVGYMADATGGYTIPFFACAILGAASLLIRTTIYKRIQK